LPAETDDMRDERPLDRGVARRQAFLQAARQVFLQQGYEAASVNDVVRIAGGSLATLYSQFQNKEGLFHAVMLDQHARLTAAMAPECVDHLPLKEGLCAIGEGFLAALLEPDNLAFFRLVVGEGRHFPASARRNVSVGADQVRDVVAAFLRKHGIPASDEDSHPSILLDIWRSRYHYRAVADDSFTLSQADLKKHIAQCVDVFLHGALPRTP
jgi:AcrR family transcriptional regulator